MHEWYYMVRDSSCSADSDALNGHSKSECCFIDALHFKSCIYFGWRSVLKTVSCFLCRTWDLISAVEIWTFHFTFTWVVINKENCFYWKYMYSIKYYLKQNNKNLVQTYNMQLFLQNEIHYCSLKMSKTGRGKKKKNTKSCYASF